MRGQVGKLRLLFISLLDFSSFNERNIYTDLLREFIRRGHDVYCISPVERRNKVNTHLRENGHLLKLKIGNTQKTNIIEKGISTLMIEPLFKRAIRKYFADVKFDLILYSTPPITFANVVKYVKRRDGARSYLMLKDIFPQNAVDLGMMPTTGLKGLLHKHFRNKEKELYSLSDRIGCMSQANVDYILKHNPEIPKEKVEICPNCIEVQDMRLSEQERKDMRDKYGLPQGKKIFVYGGNLGKPQCVPFIISCLKKCADLADVYFVIAGNGTDRYLLEKYMAEEKPAHVKLFGELPKEAYDAMIACCDVGLIFLDHRFTIPNFPSRLLVYMQAGLPVLASTDPNTDIGTVLMNGGFGKYCESICESNVKRCICEFTQDNLREMGEKAYLYLESHYGVEGACQAVLK